MTHITTFLSPSGQQRTMGSGPATRIQIGTLEGVATLERAEFGAPWALKVSVRTTAGTREWRDAVVASS